MIQIPPAIFRNFLKPHLATAWSTSQWWGKAAPWLVFLVFFPLQRFIPGNTGYTAGGLIYLCLFSGNELFALLLMSLQNAKVFCGDDAYSLQSAEEPAALPAGPLCQP